MSSATITHVLPRYIDPRKFAQQGVSLSGDIEISMLDRICPLLASDRGRVNVDLVFGVDEQGIRNLTGSASALVEMVCQRCLDGTTQSLSISFNLAMVCDDEKAEQLLRSWDPWIVGEGQADIYSVVEDELILSLPIVAYHSEACVEVELFSSGDHGDTASGEQRAEKPSPFDVLEQLKGNLKKD